MDEKKFHWKNLTKNMLCAIIAILAVTILLIAIFVNSALNKINRVTDQETLTPEEIEVILAQTDDPENPIPEEYLETTISETTPVTEITTEITNETEAQILPTEPAATEPEKASDVINILLVGQDRRIHETRQRSDAMILCSINTETGTLVMTSFLRDTYVTLPEYNGETYGMNRLNVTYLLGGFEMLNDCLEENFGIHVDHNVEVDFSGFKAVVDILGGVDIELTRKEAQIVEGDVHEGMNHLDGGQALMYARIRKLDNDFARTDRQRKVLMALFEKTRDIGIQEVVKLIDILLPLITTDMDKSDIIGYIARIYPIWHDLQIITQSVPTKGEYHYKWIDGMSVVVPNVNKVRQRISETIG